MKLKNWLPSVLRRTKIRRRRSPDRRASITDFRIETLEDRTLLAAVLGNGTDLFISLEASEQLSIVSNGSSYTFGSNSSFTDSGVADAGDFVGFGSSSLTLNDLSQYNTVSVFDDGAGSSVVFNDSGGNTYTDQFFITLDVGAAVPGLSFNGTSTFEPIDPQFGNRSLVVDIDTSIQFNSGSLLSTVDHDIDLKANEDGSAAGAFSGIRLNNATIQTTGDGNISLLAQGGDDAGTAGQFGIVLNEGKVHSTKTGANAGTITINGTGGTGTDFSIGVFLSGTTTAVTSVDGAISITGQGGSGTGIDHHGVNLQTDAAIQVTSAPLTVIGTATAGNSLGVRLSRLDGGQLRSIGSGSIHVTASGSGTSSDLVAGSDSVVGGPLTTGPISLIADTVDFEGTLNVQSAGDLTIAPRTPTTTIGLGGGSGDLNLTDAELAFLADGFSSITIGDVDAGTGAVQIDTVALNDPIRIAGGTINDGAATDVTAPLVTLAGNASPGQSPGILNVAGNAMLGDGATYTVEIGGTSPGDSATDHDQLSATGAVTIAENVTLVTSLVDPFTPTVGDTFTIIERTGGTGTFAGLAEGDVIPDFPGTGVDAVISYTGGDGNDVVIKVVNEVIEVDIAADENDGAGAGAGTSLRDAILLANTQAGTDHIAFASALNGVPITLSIVGTDSLGGDLDILGDVVITGNGSGNTVVDASGIHRVFEVFSGVSVTISDVTLTGGHLETTAGGAIRNTGNLTLSDSVLAGNRALHGGAIEVTASGVATIHNTTFSDNHAAVTGVGGAISNLGTTSLHGSTITGSSARNGGGVLSNGTLEVVDSEVSGNSATPDSGGGYGGGILSSGGDASLTVTGSTVSNNQATVRGGGILSASPATLTHSTVSGNRAGSDGGGLWNSNLVSITNTTVSDNYAGHYGGGIWNSGDLTVTGSVVSRNMSVQLGGGVLNTETLTMSGSRVNENTASAGGGIFNGTNDTVNIDASTLSMNRAVSPTGGHGGGIRNFGTLTVTASTLSHNSAVRIGGGIQNERELTLTNSTLSGNTAGVAGGGLQNASNATVYNNTVTDNTADFGGGVANAGTLTIANTIIAENTATTSGPGGSTGILSVEGDLALHTDSTLHIEIDGTTVGSQHDQVQVLDAGSTVDLAGATLSVSGSYTPVSGDIFTIVSGTEVIGQFAGLSDGARLSLNGQELSIHYLPTAVTLVVVTQAVTYVDDSFAGNFNDPVTDADAGTSGDQPAVLGVNAFTTIAEAVAVTTASGTIIVNSGTYTEAVTLFESQTLSVSGPDAAQSVTVDSVNGPADTTLQLEGSLTLVGAGTSSVGQFHVRSNRPDTDTLTIPVDHSLTVNGDASFGVPSTNGVETNFTALGGGDLIIPNALSTIDFGLASNSSANQNTTIIDLTGLGSLTTNVDSILVGSGQRNSSVLRLSDTANFITATTFSIGNSGGSNARSASVTLGAGTNQLHVDNIELGRGKGNGTLSFTSQTPASPGTVTIRGKAGGNTGASFLLGQTGASTGSNPNGNLELRGHTVDVVAGTLTMALRTGGGSGGARGTLSMDAGTFTVDTIDMARRSNGSNAATATINIGGGSFTVNAGGSFQMANQTGGGSANGTVNITGGILTSNVDITDAGGTSTTTINLDGGTLDLTGHNIGGAIPIDVLNFQSGALQNVAQMNDGATGLSKTSTGTLTLAGTNTHTAATMVSDGTLLVTGTQIGGGDYTISGGTLGGSGTIGSAVNAVGGTIAPRTSPGVLTVDGNVTLDTNSTFSIEINGNTPDTQYDQLQVQGVGRNVDLTAATLDVNLGFTPADGDAFTILNLVDAGSSITGTFAGLSEGSGFLVGGTIFRITYVGGTGNDVVLTAVTPVDLVGSGFNAVSDHVLLGQTDVVFEVTNQGEIPVGAFDTHIMWSADDVIGNGDDVLVANTLQSFAGLAAGASAERTISVQLDLAALYADALASNPAGLPVGTMSNETSHLYVVIDTDDAVAEGDETNNSRVGHLIDSDDITYFPWDMGGNGTVTPIEALRTIQAVNTPDAVYDSDGNGVVTPLEALAALQRIGLMINDEVVGDAPAGSAFEFDSATVAASGSKFLVAATETIATQAISNENSQASVPAWLVTDDPDDELFTFESASESEQLVKVTAESDGYSELDEQFTESLEWLSVI